MDSSTPCGLVFVKKLYGKGVEYVNLIAPNGEKVQLQQQLDLKSADNKSSLYGLAHIGIVVSDIKRSKRFYEQFGFKEVFKTKIKGDQDEAEVIILRNVGVNIQLIQPADKLEEVKLRKDGHIDHIAFDVRDVEKAFQELRDSGIKVLEEKPVFLPFWERGIKYFNILGPDGERLEFSQKL